jgi:hypothetical protein
MVKFFDAFIAEINKHETRVQVEKLPDSNSAHKLLFSPSTSSSAAKAGSNHHGSSKRPPSSSLGWASDI